MKDFAEVMEKLEDIKELKDQLVSCFKAEIASKGLNCVDTKEAGDVTDMIKDLAETERNCWEALYYQKVIEAMTSYDEPRYGYNANRSSKTGRYVSKPSMPRMGFHPHEKYTEYDGNMEPDDYMHEAMMGYAGNNMRMEHVMDGNPRYGRAYNEYQTKRRHYTSSKSPEDKREMNVHAEEHVKDSIETIHDIWNDADPMLKRKMKEDFTKLVNDMNV